MMLWGTYGKSGTEPLKWILLQDCETDHLQAILKTQILTPLYKSSIEKILMGRNVFPEGFNIAAAINWINGLSPEAIANIS